MKTQPDEVREQRKAKSRELRDRTGLTQFKFAAMYDIPIDSVKNWEAGRTVPPEYVLKLLERAVNQDFPE